MPDPKLQFLPWTRRGLAAELQTVDDGSATLPARSTIGVSLSVSNLAANDVVLQLFGPGDILGIDPNLIVRTDPPPRCTDAEPNYCVAIEFDPPDFPWLFTPAKPDANNRLRPWCVLVVVDLDFVAAPRLPRGAPLPVLSIPRALVAQELPDLAESWAFAHAQLLTDAVAADTLASQLETMWK